MGLPSGVWGQAGVAGAAVVVRDAVHVSHPDDAKMSRWCRQTVKGSSPLHDSPQTTPSGLPRKLTSRCTRG
jgi:hypothetical protein